MAPASGAHGIPRHLVCRGYLVFSFITLHEPRHDLMALLPLPILAVLAIKEIAGIRFRKAGLAVAGLAAAGSIAWSVMAYPVHWVSGYSEAADVVLKQAPRNSVVLFSGYRDGSFIFNIRAGERPDLSVARADKFLVRVSIMREHGIQDRNLNAGRIEELIKRHAIRYVVAETGFWDDLPSMAALNSLLRDTIASGRCGGLKRELIIQTLTASWSYMSIWVRSMRLRCH